MIHYTFYELDTKNSIVRGETYQCANDLDAMSKARGLHSDNAIEIWDSRGRVGRVKRDCMPLNLKTAIL